jgi:AAA15 family ATPase/GTPase
LPVRMVQRIAIENFRCFEHFVLDGLARVNLFGGPNNCGKTALLEAVYLGEHTDVEKVSDLYVFRNEKWNDINTSANPFRNLFADPGNEIHICLDNSSLSIAFKGDVLYIGDSSSTLFGDLDPRNLFYSISKIKELFASHHHSILFQPSQYRSVQSAYFNHFVQDETEGNADAYLKAFRTIDRLIKAVRSKGNDRRIQVELEGQKGLFPISVLGDAVNRISCFIGSLLRGSTRILLIDEIENGLHFTKQEEFWTILFRLAIEHDVQILANTHSLEMIRAYNAAIQTNGWASEAAYFELYRDVESGSIDAERLDAELLDYRLQMGRHLRGEAS